MNAVPILLSPRRGSETPPPSSSMRFLPRSRRDNRRVLVVDDFEDMRALYMEALGDAGYEVLTASNGDDAIVLALRTEPSVILMDLSMPGTDGWEATKRIRAAEEDSGAYVIALTAAASPESRRQAFECGCDAFIAKPCTPDVVVSAVSAVIQRRAG